MKHHVHMNLNREDIRELLEDNLHALLGVPESTNIHVVFDSAPPVVEFTACYDGGEP